MTDTKNEIAIYDRAKTGELIQSAEPVTARNAPAIVKAAGKSAEFAWEEFFQAEIANAHTRKNYMHAVRQFLAWVEERNLELPRISPGDVGEYLQSLELATPTKKLHLAALRRFFDRLVNRHVCVINPAATVKAERHSVVEGKTPDIGPTQARSLLKSITVTDPVGLRDRAVLAVLIYTAARVGAVAKLTDEEFRERRFAVHVTFRGERWEIEGNPSAARSGAIPTRLCPGREYHRRPPLPHRESQVEDANKESDDWYRYLPHDEATSQIRGPAGSLLAALIPSDNRDRPLGAERPA